VAVAPLEDGLVMELLRYANELREPAEYFDEVRAAKPQKDMVDLAVQLIEKKSGPFDATKFEDHYGLGAERTRAGENEGAQDRRERDGTPERRQRRRSDGSVEAQYRRGWGEKGQVSARREEAGVRPRSSHEFRKSKTHAV